MAQLLKEIRNDNTEKVLELLQTVDNFSEHDKKGKSALHLVIENQNAELLEELLRKVDPSEVEYKGKNGDIPLFYCLEFGFWRGIEILLQHGVDPNYQNEEGITALHHAAVNNSTEAIKTLMNHKADVNFKCQRGTALHLAISEGANESALYLIENAEEFQIDFLSEDSDGNTIFHIAVIEGLGGIFMEAVNYVKNNSSLNQDGAIFNAKNQLGNSILHEAYLNERTAIIKVLLEEQNNLKLNIDLKNNEGKTGIQIEQQMKADQEKEKEEKIIQREVIKQQVKERQQQEREEFEQERIRQEEDKKNAVKREEQMKHQAENQDKQSKFAMVVILVILFMVVYLVFKQAAEQPKGGYIE